MQVLAAGQEFLEAAASGDESALKKLFAARTHVWTEVLISEDECTFGLFNDLEERLEPHVAFSLVPVAIDIAMEAQSKEKFEQAIWLLLGIIESTQTTEVPKRLAQEFKQLEAKAKESGSACADEILAIKSYYRNAI